MRLGVCRTRQALVDLPAFYAGQWPSLAHGQSAERVVDELIALTPEVIKSVRAKLPLDFSEVLAESILGGLQTSADKLAG